MNHSMPGLPVHHQLLQFTQTHVHRVSDAVQPSHPLLSPSHGHICTNTYDLVFLCTYMKEEGGFPCSSVGKESACSAGDLGLIAGLGRSPGEANGNQLQYPCLENQMDRGAWWVTVHGVTKSWT